MQVFGPATLFKTEAVVCTCSSKSVFLKIFTGKHLCWSLFLVKFLTNFIKGTPTQVFSCEIWKNYKNTFSTEHLQWLLLSKETSAQVCLPVKFTKFLRTPFFTEHLRWLLLNGSFSLVRLCNNKNQHYFLLISCLF